MTRIGPDLRHLTVAALLVALAALAACQGGHRQPPPSDDAPAGLPGPGDEEVVTDLDDRPAPTPLGPGDVEEAWRWAAEPPGSVGMPAVHGEEVAVAYGHLRLALLDLEGDLLWETERSGLRDVAPRFAGDLVLAATEEGVMALDRATGAVRWDTSVGERANTPVVAGGHAVASTWDESIVAFDLDDGRLAWQVPLPGVAIGPGATDGTAVAVTWESALGEGAGVVVVEAGDGRLRWSAPLEPGGNGGPAVVATDDGPVVVLVAGDIAAHGLSLADGSPLWRIETQGAGSPEVPPLPLAGGEVLVAHRLGGLVLLDAATGRSRWQVTSDGAAVRGGPAGRSVDGAAGGNGPARAEGPFAFPLDDGRLLLAGPGRQAATLDWPGRVSGVTVSSSGLLLVGTREAKVNHLLAFSGW